MVCTAPSFDLVLTGLYPPLICGRTLQVVPETQDFSQLTQTLLESEALTPLKLTPSHLAMLLESLHGKTLGRQVHTLVLGGEVLKGSLIKRWREHSPGSRIFNHYGPTETTIGCVVNEIAECQDGSLPIGRPIANTRAYILNEALQPVPIGVRGELYIAGAGVTRGYLNRPDLTQERYLADAFSEAYGARMYRTGDMARWRNDGIIEYLGRNDDQVKVRGFRIELGEIEAQLARHAQVRSAVVMAREIVPGEKRLVAYVVPGDISDAPNTESLRQHLKEVLPDYMIPSAIVVLDSLPLTPNGKVNRRALPEPEAGSYAIRQYEPPEGEVEEALALIWQDLLRVERIGRYDDFFELGGHSLHIMRFSARVAEKFGVELPIFQVFQYPTLAQIAPIVESLSGVLEQGTL